jgi:hypothetical protein
LSFLRLQPKLDQAAPIEVYQKRRSIINRTSVNEACKRSDQRRAFAGALASAGVIKMQTEQDRYADLEKPIEDIRYMAAIVTRVMEGGLEAGDVTIAAQSWETFSFAVYHLQELVNRLGTQYHRDGEADAG